jgi:hypothetical protein
MKYTVIILIALCVGILGFAYLTQRSDWHARIVYSRFELRRALTDLKETGGLLVHTNTLFGTNVARPFIFTNVVVIDGTSYHCAAAYDDPVIHDAGFLAATTNGVFIYFDKKSGPRLMPSD